MDSFDPAFDGEEMQHGQEVPAKFFESCCQPSHVLHSAEEALDDIAHGVESRVMGNRFARIAFRRNDSERAFISYVLANLSAAVGLISDNCEGWLFPVEKGAHHLTVMDMAASNFDPQRAALCIYGRMNFTCATSA